VFRVGDAGEMVDQPPLERADLLVDHRQDTAGRQQFSQMCRGSPRLEGVECLVGQGDFAAGEFSQEVRGCPIPAFAWMQPAQPGPRVVHREQVLDEWDEFGLDAAGAVVEEFGESLLANGVGGLPEVTVGSDLIT
jgi:hypothetical protein